MAGEFPVVEEDIPAAVGDIPAVAGRFPVVAEGSFLAEEDWEHR